MIQFWRWRSVHVFVFPQYRLACPTILIPIDHHGIGVGVRVRFVFARLCLRLSLGVSIQESQLRIELVGVITITISVVDQLVMIDVRHGERYILLTVRHCWIDED